MTVLNKRFIYYPLTIGILLLIPLIAMQVSSEVSWSFGDFCVMGILLLITGLALDYIWTRVKNKDRKVLFGLIILLLFFLIWAELAVGIFGTPLAGS